MSQPVVGASTETGRSISGPRGSAASPRHTRSKFYVGMSGTLLVIVLIGFTPTLYLRTVFDAPDLPAYLLLHGVVLTAWFAGAFVQTVLVAAHRTDLHRRMGWFLGGLGAAVFLISFAVTVAFAPRQRALGVDLEASMTSIARVVWGDVVALLAFALFVTTALALRRRAETHKRLMLLASLSIVQPAMARIGRWPVFEGLDPALFSLAGTLSLFLAVGVHDVISTRRLHAVTLVGGLVFIGLWTAARHLVPTLELGRSMIRWLG